MKYYFLLLSLSLIACSNQNSGSRTVNFYGKEVLVPNSLKPSKPLDYVNSITCDSHLNLLDTRDSTVVNLKLCGHGHVKWKSFKKLDFFFKEQVSVIEENSKQYDLIEKNSTNKEVLYEFNHYIKDTYGYHLMTYVAFEDYYIFLNIYGENKSQIDTYRKNFDYIKNESFVNGISLSEKDSEQACLNCMSPYFW